MKSVHLILFSFMSIVAGLGQSRYDFNVNNTIGYSVNLMTFSEGGLYKGFKQHSLMYQRILTRRVSLIFGYTITRYKSEIGFWNSPHFIFKTRNQFGSILDYELYPIGEAVVNTNSLNLGVRSYIGKKGAIAPYGRFFEFKIGNTRIKTKGGDNISYGNNYDNRTFKDELPDYGMSHLNVLSLQTGYGSSRPVYKSIYIDWLINLNMNIPMWGMNSSKTSVNYRDLYYLRNAYIVYKETTRLRFNIGLHYGF